MSDLQESSRGGLSEVRAVFLRLGAMSYGGAAIMGIMQDLPCPSWWPAPLSASSPACARCNG